MPTDQPDERQMIAALCRQINAVMDASGATPGCLTIAAIITAARYARRTALPASVATAMLAEHIVRGEPV
jgi:hypothetical protein